MLLGKAPKWHVNRLSHLCSQIQVEVEELFSDQWIRGIEVSRILPWKLLIISFIVSVFSILNYSLT